MRRFLTVTLTAVLTITASGPAEATGRARPDIYVLDGPTGAAPEGIAVHADGTIWTGSSTTGRLYRGNIRDDRLTPVNAPGTLERGTTLGVHTDNAGNIWSVGGNTLTVHDRSGRLRATASAADGPIGPPKLNDFALTPTAVYITDFANPTVLRAERRGTHIGPLRPWLDMRTAMPGFPPQYWFLNGIVADPTGTNLLVAGNGPEALWRVDTTTRQTTEVDLGGRSFGADGMQLRNRTLYAVVNYASPNGVYIINLDPTLASGTISSQTLLSGQPTTLALHQCRIYVVNAPHVQAIPDPTCY